MLIQLKPHGCSTAASSSRPEQAQVWSLPNWRMAVSGPWNSRSSWLTTTLAAWSAPSAIGLGGFGFGGQLGAEVTDFLIVLNVSVFAGADHASCLIFPRSVPYRGQDFYGCRINDARWQPLGACRSPVSRHPLISIATPGRRRTVGSQRRGFRLSQLQRQSCCTILVQQDQGTFRWRLSRRLDHCGTPRREPPCISRVWRQRSKQQGTTQRRSQAAFLGRRSRRRVGPMHRPPGRPEMGRRQHAGPRWSVESRWGQIRGRRLGRWAGS